MPKLNPDITLTLVIALSAIISPVIVSIINNHYSFKIKKQEYEHQLSFQKWDAYYKNAIKAYTELLINTGSFLGETNSLEFYYKILPSIYNAYAYANQELASSIDTLVADIDKLMHIPKDEKLLDTCQKDLFKISKIINNEIKSMFSAIECK
jgi:hypothetical protein